MLGAHTFAGIARVQGEEFRVQDLSILTILEESVGIKGTRRSREDGWTQAGSEKSDQSGVHRKNSSV